MSVSPMNINILKKYSSDTSNLFNAVTLPEENIDGAAILNAPQLTNFNSQNVNQEIHQDLVSLRCLIVMRCARNDGFLCRSHSAGGKNIHPNICGAATQHIMFFILFFCDRLGYNNKSAHSLLLFRSLVCVV